MKWQRVISERSKKIRIKSLILREEETIEKISIEEFEKALEKANNIPEEEFEEMVEATKVYHIAREMDTNIIEMNVTEEDYKNLYHIFKLYGIPIKPIENGIEVDIREKEPYEPEYPEWQIRARAKIRLKKAFDEK